MWRKWRTIRSWFFPGSGTTVGWLCTIPKDAITTLYLNTFTASLADNTVNIKDLYGSGKYDAANTDLIGKAQDLVKANVGVIVAVGGIRSLQAAVSVAKATNNTIPILYYVGQDLQDSTVGHNNVKGGIDLDMPTNDAQRIAELKAAPYNATNVGLLVNLNAAMGQPEIDNWVGGPVEACGGSGETNVQIKTNLAAHVGNLIKKGADGIVVSADPFFSSIRGDLVPLLNSTNLPVSYPFDHYSNTGRVRATPGKSMRFGPDMIDGYTKLGAQTKKVLTGVDPGKIPIPNNAHHW